MIVVHGVSVSRILHISSLYLFSTWCICIQVTSCIQFVSIQYKVQLYPGYFMYPVCIYILQGASVSSVYLYSTGCICIKDTSCIQCVSLQYRVHLYPGYFMYPVCIYIVQGASVSRILNVSVCIFIVQGVSVSKILHVSSVYLYCTGCICIQDTSCIQCVSIQYRVYLYSGYFMYPVCIYIVQGVSVSRILHVSSVYLYSTE